MLLIVIIHKPFHFLYFQPLLHYFLLKLLFSGVLISYCLFKVVHLLLKLALVGHLS